MSKKLGRIASNLQKAVWLWSIYFTLKKIIRELKGEKSIALA